jgi:hypothetical protein
MGRKMNWDRPRYRTAGKVTESVSGGDIPAEFRGAPPRASISKAEARATIEQLTAEFLARGGRIRKSPRNARNGCTGA